MAKTSSKSPRPCTVDEAINRLRAYTVEQGWTRTRLAREAGLSDTVLRKFDDPDWNPTADTLRTLQRVVPDHFVFSGNGKAA